MLASLVLKLEVTHARPHLKSQLVYALSYLMCDLENVSQSAKDLFEVTYVCAQSQVWSYKKITISMH